MEREWMFVKTTSKKNNLFRDVVIDFFLWLVFFKLSSHRFPNIKMYLMNNWNSKQICSMQKAAKPIDHIWNCNLSQKVQIFNQKMRSKKMNIDDLITTNFG